MKARILALAASALLAACTTPQPLDEHELVEKALGAKAASRVVPLPGRPLAFGDVAARALAENLDIRVADLESVIARGAIDLADIAKLPSLVAQAGYTRRTPPGAVSDKIPGDAERSTKSTELSWSVLDFGVSYLRAKQAANDALAADERRRRVSNAIVNDCRLAFWTAALGARRLPELRAISRDIEEAMKRSRKLVEARLQDPVIALTYQDALLELQRQIRSYEVELAQAQGRLARMLNAYPGAEIALEAPAPDETFRGLAGLERPTLEDLALVTRPELRELDYQTRNRNIDIYASMLAGLPNFRVRAARLYDSTTSLVDNHWREEGWGFSFNVLGLIQGLMRSELSRQGVMMFELRRLGLGLAVMEQVGISREQLAAMDDDYRLALEISTVRRDIYRIRRDRLPFDSTDELERIRAAVSAVAAAIREDKAYASLQKAYGDMLAALGVDQFPEDFDPAAPNAALAIESHLASLPASLRLASDRIEALRAENARRAEGPKSIEGKKE